jgi:outer membrane protein
MPCRLLAISCATAFLTGWLLGAADLGRCQQLAFQEQGAAIPVLTLDEAVGIALANNRNVKVASMNVEASRQQFLAAKTKRLPSLSTYAFGGESLTGLNFTVKQGQLGTYQATGPIPSHNMSFSTPQTPTAFVVAQVSQPLLTLYKVNLYLKGQKLAVGQAREQLRGARQSISAGVRQAYYGIVQAEQVVEATKASIQQYQELDRITAEYVSEKTTLKSDALTVEAKLAEQKLVLMQSQDKLQSAQESLNELLGRDINTPFRTAPINELSPVEENLQAAQAKALLNHPEIKEAELTVQQAKIQRRLAKAKYLPDLNLSFHYISPFGINFLPSNIAAVGFEFKWDPFDWGGRGHTLKQQTIVLDESKQQLEETKAQILVNVDNLFRSLQEAKAAVAVAAAYQQAALENAREATDQYGQKAVLLRDALQQQAAAEATNAQYIQAEAAFWTAKANFQKAIGEE